MPTFRANRKLHRRAEAGQVFSVDEHEAKNHRFQELESKGIIERVHSAPKTQPPKPQALDLKSLVGYENKSLSTQPTPVRPVVVKK